MPATETSYAAPTDDHHGLHAATCALQRSTATTDACNRSPTPHSAPAPTLTSTAISHHTAARQVQRTLCNTRMFMTRRRVDHSLSPIGKRVMRSSVDKTVGRQLRSRMVTSSSPPSGKHDDHDVGSNNSDGGDSRDNTSEEWSDDEFYDSDKEDMGVYAAADMHEEPGERVQALAAHVRRRHHSAYPLALPINVPESYSQSKWMSNETLCEVMHRNVQRRHHFNAQYAAFQRSQTHLDAQAPEIQLAKMTRDHVLLIAQHNDEAVHAMRALSKATKKTMIDAIHRSIVAGTWTADDLRVHIQAVKTSNLYVQNQENRFYLQEQKRIKRDRILSSLETVFMFGVDFVIRTKRGRQLVHLLRQQGRSGMRWTYESRSYSSASSVNAVAPDCTLVENELFINQPWDCTVDGNDHVWPMALTGRYQALLDIDMRLKFIYRILHCKVTESGLIHYVLSFLFMTTAQ